LLKKVNEFAGIPIDFVVEIPSIPRTSSGKLQRFMLVNSLKNNAFADQTMSAAELLGVQASAVVMAPDGNVVRGDIREKIRAIWARVLELPVEAVSSDEPFLALGGTSLMAVQVLEFLEDELKLSLTHDILLKCRTVREMETYILNMAGDQERAKTLVIAASDEATGGPIPGDIAVISMACRFPDASTPEEFWNNLVQGKCSIAGVPSNRWNHNEYYSPMPEFGKTYSHTAALIDNVYDFDADLFNISEQEAAVMDPQQRLILELVYELVERAGYSRRSVSGKSIGLYIGASTNSYYEYHLKTLIRLYLQEFDSFCALKGEQQEAILNEWKRRFGVTPAHPNILADNMLNMLAGRASQEFNFKGPSLVLDAACSSSLLSIHMACESIRRGECKMAIVGSINLLLTPTAFVYLKTLSKSGCLRAFDADADGFVLGEGAGMVMLKPLIQAIADHDEILAVIKASGINNTGRSIGVMSPNPDGQREVIESLYRRHRINPESIQYIEAHGVGTKIGDTSEVRALDSAFKPWSLARRSIAIGSVKSNIGHLMSASGIASFIKVVLMLNHREMPPSINLTTPHPLFKIDRTPFYFLNETKAWNADEGSIRRAGLNSFAFGGTNCHMVVEEAPLDVPVAQVGRPERGRQVMCLSAQTETALEQKMNDLAECLEKNPKYSIADVCYAENTGRTVLKCRRHIVADSAGDLIDQLRRGHLAVRPQGRPRVVLMFTGQSSQYVGMGRELYQHLPTFRKYVDECSTAFAPYLNVKITELIYGDSADSEFLARTNIAQAIVFALDYALGSLLLELGVEPEYMLGHSVGEWVAACLAGVVSLQDAARLVSCRGKLMSELTSAGAMAAVFTDETGLESLLVPWRDSLWVAAYNISHHIVSGRAEALDSFLLTLQKKGLVTKKLSYSQAFHTPLMSPMLDAFRAELSATTFATPKIPIVSNLTASVYEQPFTADYWTQHILGAVKFEQSIRYLLDKGIDIFVESGPDKILTAMVAVIGAGYGKSVLATMDSKKDNWETLLTTLGEMFSLGVDLDWKAFEQGISYQKVSLPAYPFERKTFMPDFGGALSSMQT
jgi:acyl transferase domain-containing protein/acyl carrier protein